jgi:hypothetical protein
MDAHNTLDILHMGTPGTLYTKALTLTHTLTFNHMHKTIDTNHTKQTHTYSHTNTYNNLIYLDNNHHSYTQNACRHIDSIQNDCRQND